MSVSRHKQIHDQLGIPDSPATRLQQFYDDIDAEGGVLEAQVVHRFDTLAALLSVQDAAEGEIAVASDRAALVRYTGTPSVGSVFMASTMHRELVLTGNAISVPASTETVIPLSAGVAYNNGFSISGDTIIDVPAQFDVSLSGVLVMVSGGDITTASVTLQYEISPGVWGPAAAAFTRIVSGRIEVSLPLFGVNKLAAGAPLRLVMQHDSAAARTIAGNSRLRVQVGA